MKGTVSASNNLNISVQKTECYILQMSPELGFILSLNIIDTVICHFINIHWCAVVIEFTYWENCITSTPCALLLYYYYAVSEYCIYCICLVCYTVFFLYLIHWKVHWWVYMCCINLTYRMDCSNIWGPHFLHWSQLSAPDFATWFARKISEFIYDEMSLSHFASLIDVIACFNI